MNSLSVLLEQQQQQGGGGNMIFIIVVYALIIGAFYRIKIFLCHISLQYNIIYRLFLFVAKTALLAALTQRVTELKGLFFV